MKQINPFVGLFVAMATLMTAFFVPVFVLLIDHGERLAAVEATVDAVQSDIDDMRAEHGERLARVEAAIAALARDLAAVEATVEAMQVDIDDMQAAIAALSGDLAATNERMARIEGTVAGALGRPFPERMAEAPANPAAGG